MHNKECMKILLIWKRNDMHDNVFGGIDRIYGYYFLILQNDWILGKISFPWNIFNFQTFNLLHKVFCTQCTFSCLYFREGFRKPKISCVSLSSEMFVTFWSFLQISCQSKTSQCFPLWARAFLIFICRTLLKVMLTCGGLAVYCFFYSRTVQSTVHVQIWGLEVVLWRDS